VGDVELTPDYTSYARILHVQTYDVLAVLAADRRRSISGIPKLEKGRDDGDFATAHFHYSAKLLGRIARVLGDAGAAQRYETLAENIRSAPVVGGDLTWARARLDSPYGPIESEWRIASDERFELQMTVPPGTAADIKVCHTSGGLYDPIS
jgi:hypothetical protein